MPWTKLLRKPMVGLPIVVALLLIGPSAAHANTSESEGAELQQSSQPVAVSEMGDSRPLRSTADAEEECGGAEALDRFAYSSDDRVGMLDCSGVCCRGKNGCSCGCHGDTACCVSSCNACCNRAGSRPGEQTAEAAGGDSSRVSAVRW